MVDPVIVDSVIVEPVIELSGVRFAYAARKQDRSVLQLEQFKVSVGERVFLHGASGSGKSTLLGLIGGVLEAQAGCVRVLGKELTQLQAAQRDQLRADHIGFIFQMFNLLPYLSVIDNVLLPTRFSARRAAYALQQSNTLEAEAHRLLHALGLDDAKLLQRRATELSQGQQQRVAAARALLGGPSLVIADEPTSALDADTRTTFLDLLLTECARDNAAMLFVSHDRSLSTQFDRSIGMNELNRVTTEAAHA